MLNSFSSLFGALLITLYYRRSKEFDKNQTMPKLFKFYWVAATLSVAVSTSVTTVYWPFSYTGSDKGLNDALTHAVNSAILVLDVFVNAHPPKFGHFIFPLCFGVTYGFIFSVPYTFLGGTDRWYNNYIYPSLDWKGETSTAFIFTFSTIILMSVMHLVVSLLAMLRIFIHKKIGLTKEIQKSESALNEV